MRPRLDSKRSKEQECWKAGGGGGGGGGENDVEEKDNSDNMDDNEELLSEPPKNISCFRLRILAVNSFNRW